MKDFLQRLRDLSPEKKELVKKNLKNKENDRVLARLEADVEESRWEFPPHMAENLKMEYFYFQNGESDEYPRLLECDALMLYFTLKRKVIDFKRYLYLFLHDPVFSIIQKHQQKIFEINILTYPYRDDIFTLNFNETRGYKAMMGIEALLDRGELVIVSTFIHRIPFFFEFQGFTAPDIPEKRGHNFLVVAHDPIYLYYVEMPDLINPQLFIPYPSNKSVGMVKKTDLAAAFDIYVYYCTISINREKLHYGIPNLKGLFELSRANYFKGTEEKKGCTFFYGQAALDLLIRLCEKECLQLKSTENLHTTGLHNLFRWKFHVIAARRRGLKEALENFSGDFNVSLKDEMIGILDQLSREWFYAKDLAVRKFALDQEYTVGREFGELFQKIKVLEDELVRKMSACC